MRSPRESVRGDERVRPASRNRGQDCPTCASRFLAISDASDFAAPELAASTVASAAALAVPGVATLSYFEEWGPRGVTTAGGIPLPVLDPVTAVAELSGSRVCAVTPPTASCGRSAPEAARATSRLSRTSTGKLGPSRSSSPAATSAAQRARRRLRAPLIRVRCKRWPRARCEAHIGARWWPIRAPTDPTLVPLAPPYVQESLPKIGTTRGRCTAHLPCRSGYLDVTAIAGGDSPPTATHHLTRSCSGMAAMAPRNEAH